MFLSTVQRPFSDTNESGPAMRSRALPNQNGHSLIEAAVFFFILAPLIGMMLGFTRYFQIREKLLLAAWEGAQLYSSGCIAPAEVQQKLNDFLSTGAPALPPDRIKFTHMGKANLDFINEIDEVAVSYTVPRAWHYGLKLPLTVEEKCFIKHAPHYWDPVTADLAIPGQPALTGPEYRW
jgi:hypothetical protein